MFEKYRELFVSDEEYYGDFNFVTNSQLGLLKKSPKAYQDYRNGEKKETQAMTFGRAFHLAILEPDKFYELVVQEPIVNKRTKDGRAEISEFLISTKEKGQIALSVADYDKVRIMQDELFANPKVMELLSGGVAEQVSAWEDPDTGVYCKAKADYVKSNMVIDIKTTQDPSTTGFRSSSMKFGYDRQAAYYLDGFGKRDFVFIAIDKTRPHTIAIYQCSPEFIMGGMMEYKRLLSIYKEYFILENEIAENHFIEGIL